jgi:hypothetical protein
VGDVVVVCGSRTWSEYRIIRAALLELPRGTKIRHGGAPGADLISAHQAAKIGLEVEPAFRPNYKEFSRWDAPKRRNTEMLETKPIPKGVLAFWDGKSGGTLDTIIKACERNIPVIIYTMPKVKKDVYVQQGLFNDWGMKFARINTTHKIEVEAA